MLLDFSSLEPKYAYAWMTSLITPRPIAWVSTVSADGKTNLAPFSFFSGVTSNPPTLMFVPVNTRDGNKKDTVRNIEAVPEFVVNVVPHALAEPMNDTAALLPHGESEFSAFGIEATASQHIRPPRVTKAPAAFECRLHQIVNVGEGPLAAHIVIGRILCAHISDDVLDERGRVDVTKLDAVGRMEGEYFTTTRDRFSFKRPDRK